MSRSVTRATTTEKSAAPEVRLTIHPVILAGGSGTRLWPMSREPYPKQLISLLGKDSLLQSTAHRLDITDADFTIAEKLTVVANEAHSFTTAKQLRETGKAATVILEPIGRDTAPALTVAALSIASNDRDGIMVVMPADHAMTDVAEFHVTLATAIKFADANQIVTMGIAPTRAETGYGYIRLGAQIERQGGADAYRLEGFVEKPHLELAQSYFASTQYWWNSGIFVMRASTWLRAIKHFQPDVLDACEAAYSGGKLDGDFFRLPIAAFSASPSNSIDYAVMEGVSNDDSICTGVVVQLQAGWSDVGSWDSIWQLLPKDGDENVGRGRVMFEGAESTYAHSEGRLIACVGTRNLVIVETADAVLVADKSRVQDVKKVASRVNVDFGKEAENRNQRKVIRPWGHYETVDEGDRFLIKRIVVDPGAKLSLQMHHHRSERWIVLRGTGLVTCGEEQFLLCEDESTHIPLGTVHRLENPGKVPLEIVEIQSGSYIGEDDIVRFDDIYGRQC
ncbi:mannose-1-phosphate guanylyltransferase/mannose-6-phosphate isomerase [Paraburkholderia hospita]